MATFQKRLLSGSTSGRPIKVAATATPGTTIHTAVAGSDGIDEIYCYVTNTSGSAVAITFEWGGTTDPDDLVSKAVTMPAQYGPQLVIPGLPLNGGLIIKAFAGTTNVLLVTGFVNRIF